MTRPPVRVYPAIIRPEPVKVPDYNPDPEREESGIWNPGIWNPERVTQSLAAFANECIRQPAAGIRGLLRKNFRHSPTRASGIPHPASRGRQRKILRQSPESDSV